MPYPNFIVLDVITPYPVGNPNRDDLGRPKQSQIGSDIRQRISSQCLKRSIRNSEVMQGASIEKMTPEEVARRALAEGENADQTIMSLRTRSITKILNIGLALQNPDVDTSILEAMSLCVRTGLRGKSAVFSAPKTKAPKGKPKEATPEQTVDPESGIAQEAQGDEDNLSQDAMKAVLEFFSLYELYRIISYGTSKLGHPDFVKFISSDSKSSANEFVSSVLKDVSDGHLLSKDAISLDVAIFGRMFAATPAFSVSGALSVGHSIGINSMETPDDDYWTAVDDLTAENGGAGMIDVSQMYSSIFYTPVVIDTRLLLKNLNGNAELARAAVSSLVEAFCTVAPSGKRTSTCTYTCAAWAQVRKTSRPFILMPAFIAPLSGRDPLKEAIERAEATTQDWERVYGKSDGLSMCVLHGDTTLVDLQNFASNWE